MRQSILILFVLLSLTACGKKAVISDNDFTSYDSVRWNSDALTLYVSPDDTKLYDVVQSAADDINNSLVFTLVKVTTDKSQTNTSRVYWDDDWTDQTILGQCNWSTIGRTITNSNIRLNTQLITDYGYELNIKGDLTMLIEHEILHNLGVQHNSNPDSIMYYEHTTGQTLSSNTIQLLNDKYF